MFGLTNRPRHRCRRSDRTQFHKLHILQLTSLHMDKVWSLFCELAPFSHNMGQNVSQSTIGEVSHIRCGISYIFCLDKRKWLLLVVSALNNTHFGNSQRRSTSDDGKWTDENNLYVPFTVFFQLYREHGVINFFAQRNSI